MVFITIPLVSKNNVETGEDHVIPSSPILSIYLPNSLLIHFNKASLSFRIKYAEVSVPQLESRPAFQLKCNHG
ncbi:hypothetical protein D3C76_1662180 [compost metagenome]